MFISVLFEPKRKDFIEMIVHHVATFVLCGLSYFYGHYRIGAVVKVLLDIADVPLHTAKMCRYLAVDGSKAQNVKRQTYQNGADVCFVIFTVIFTITRVVMYPYVVWSAVFEGQTVIDRESAGTVAWWIPDQLYCRILLVVLLVLQLLWFRLLCFAVYAVLTKGSAEDVRSDDDESDDETDRTDASTSDSRPKAD